MAVHSSGAHVKNVDQPVQVWNCADIDEKV